MKKFFLLFLALGAFAFAGDGDGESMIKAYSVVAAGVGLGLAALGGAIGMGHTAAATIAGTARNPGLGGKLMTTMFIALAMIEAQGYIYTCNCTNCTICKPISYRYIVFNRISFPQKSYSFFKKGFLKRLKFLIV